MRASHLLLFAPFLAGILQVMGLVAHPAAGQESDEEKRRRFLKAREQMRALPPATPATPTTARPKPRPRSTPASTPEPAPSTPEPKPSTPRSTPASPKPKPTPTPTPRTREKPTPEPTVRPKATVTPPPQPPRETPKTSRATAAPVTPSPRRQQEPPAPVVIEKSGFEEERGLQPAAPVGWFTRWKYLPKHVRKQIDAAPVKKRRWRYIVVHNSGTRQGNMKAFEYYHLRVRKMPNGLAYHFVIGNGTSSADGEIEIGSRWKRQINGGHVHSDYLNNIALGICLVGDYNRDRPTRRQMAALEELTRYLRQRVGKIDRKWAIVKPHRAINPPRWPTDCPGDRFPYRWLDVKFD